ncbi:MAG: anthranilate phosphoribosyltransferase [Phycisphaerales bacterium]|nr:anthranilate phosphoribosyltransferase [Phycisphaerales bacterium]
MEITPILARLLHAGALSTEESEWLFEELLSGRLSEAQIGAVLSLMQSRGVTVDELLGAARVMRRHVTAVPFSPPPGQRVSIVDTCGTGGAPKTFNISTAAAIIAAAASPHHTGGPVRVCVAKHGNRSRTGRGSAEVLAALGVTVDAPPDVQAVCLAEAGVCFCFAIHHHPAMRHAAGARRALGFPTIFNLLGPLTNPAGAQRQLIGVYAAELIEPVARTLARLGAQRAMVVHGLDGLDEITTTAPTRIAAVEGGVVEFFELIPRGLGIAPATIADLVIADVEASARAVREVLAGEPGPRSDIAVLNAAGAILVAGAAAAWPDAVRAARDAIETGRASATLDQLIRCSRG